MTSQTIKPNSCYVGGTTSYHWAPHWAFVNAYKPPQPLIPNLVTKLSHLSCSFARFLFLSILVPKENLNILNSATFNFCVQYYFELNSKENMVSDSAHWCSWSSTHHRGKHPQCKSGNQQLGHWKIAWQCWAIHALAQKLQTSLLQHGMLLTL